MHHLAPAVRKGIGSRAGTGIYPKTEIMRGQTVCLASCQRSPEPV